MQPGTGNVESVCGTNAFGALITAGYKTVDGLLVRNSDVATRISGILKTIDETRQVLGLHGNDPVVSGDSVLLQPEVMNERRP